jgi:hypothetical protein
VPLNDEFEGCGRNLQWPLRTPERNMGRDVGRRIESEVSQYERGILATRSRRSVTRCRNVYSVFKIVCLRRGVGRTQYSYLKCRMNGVRFGYMRRVIFMRNHV